MIALDVPLSDSQLSGRISETVAHAEPDSPSGSEWYIRILLTRGIGELSYDPAATPTASLVIIVKPLVETPAELHTNGVRAVISSVVRNHPGSVNPVIKSNNLMNNALAMQEGIRQGVFEVIMRNYRGELTECSMSNLFVVKAGAALTPPLSAGLLPGITREVILEMAPAVGVPVRESTLHDDDLFEADEAFLTGTTREILPIVEVDGQKIGSGVPGAVTQKLHAEFRRRARSAGDV
jgi:branched-chain amino acid aminotransferase